jgi:hypothetical protein
MLAEMHICEWLCSGTKEADEREQYAVFKKIYVDR